MRIHAGQFAQTAPRYQLESLGQEPVGYNRERTLRMALGKRAQGLLATQDRPALASRPLCTAAARRLQRLAAVAENLDLGASNSNWYQTI